MKTIKLQELKEIKVNIYPAEKKEERFPVLFSSETVKNNAYTRANSLWSAFVFAYQNHKAITLSVDDIMVHISGEFAQYVNKNAEKMRNKLVKHTGKMKLVIDTGVGIDKFHGWDIFFSKMEDAINENTIGNITQNLLCNFSTTESVARIISCAFLMDTMKSFFNYMRFIPECGITSVNFIGSLDDWKLVSKKLQNLKKYDIDGKWAHFVDTMTTILYKFIETYGGNPDVDWWNGIYHEKRLLGSGVSKEITGWILGMFFVTCHSKSSEIDPNSYIMNVPIELIDMPNRTKSELIMTGGFSGLSYVNEAFRPRLELKILEVKKEPLVVE